MTQNNKKAFIYGGVILLGSVIAYAIYSAKKNKLSLVDNTTVTDDQTPTPEVPKVNPFSSLVKNPLPTSIDYTFGSTTKF